jgi:hypothetical protein
MKESSGSNDEHTSKEDRKSFKQKINLPKVLGEKKIYLPNFRNKTKIDYRKIKKNQNAANNNKNKSKSRIHKSVIKRNDSSNYSTF